MINKEFTNKFALGWVESWSSLDISRILFHCTNDFKMSSPYIIKIVGEPSGILNGRDAIAIYWGKALEITSEHKYDHILILTGVNSITLISTGPKGLSAYILLLYR